MGIHDRPYMQEGYRPPGGLGGGMQIGMPKPGKAVGWLLIINIAVFVVTIFAPQLARPFAVSPAEWWELWRYVTFQFLHGGTFHLLYNMIALYFLGMYLERSWGAKRFVRFYLICGAVAGIAHVLLAHIFGAQFFQGLIGASGGVYAVILACAILFPHIRVLLLFVIPMSIRVLATIFLTIAVLNLLIGVRSAIAGGGIRGDVSDIAHLGGAAAAVVWVWLVPRIRGATREARVKINRGAWEKKMKKRTEEQVEIDRILTKIHQKGTTSLTEKEKKVLQEATRRQREEESELYKL
ncbi:MAG: rhomboid family intramembrane serine protease [Planctomycetota bacterium]|jgi:membrane associated rhomboid family serine protease